MTMFFEDYKEKEELILRDQLALERTKLANERTFFSYLRTSLYLLTVGIGIFEVKDISHLKVLGSLLLILGVVILLFGIVRYRLVSKHLKTYKIRL